MLSRCCSLSVRRKNYCFKEESSGVRPIASGYTLRRIAAKCANTFAINFLGYKLLHVQLGLVNLLYMQHVAFYVTCLLITLLLSSILVLHSIVFTEMSCLQLKQKVFLKSINFVIYLMIVHLN